MREKKKGAEGGRSPYLYTSRGQEITMGMVKNMNPRKGKNLRNHGRRKMATFSRTERI